MAGAAYLRLALSGGTIPNEEEAMMSASRVQENNVISDKGETPNTAHLRFNLNLNSASCPTI